MEEDYSRFTPEERLERICTILARWIYRAEEARKAGMKGSNTVDIGRTHNLTQAAKKIGVSKRTLQRWVRQRRLTPQRKRSGTYVISETELIKLKKSECSV
jgi:transposase